MNEIGEDEEMDSTSIGGNVDVERGENSSYHMESGQELNTEVCEMREAYEQLLAENRKLISILESTEMECKQLQTQISIKQTHINDLPTDCLLMCFQYGNVRNCIPVCKRWMEIIRNYKSYLMCTTTALCVYLRDCDDPEKKKKYDENQIIKCSMSMDGGKMNQANFTCEPKFFFDKIFSVDISVLSIQKNMSVELVKTAIATCPKAFLKQINKLNLHLSCDPYDDWSWLVGCLPFLLYLEVLISCDGTNMKNKYSITRRCSAVSISKLIAAAGGFLFNVKIDSYNYASDGSELIDTLIEKSCLPSSVGLRKVIIVPPRHHGRQITPILCFPIADIIRLIEKAKFYYRKDAITLEFHHREPRLEFITWARNHTSNVTVQSCFTERAVTVLFDFRGAKFEVCLNQAPYVYNLEENFMEWSEGDYDDDDDDDSLEIVSS